MDPPDALSGFYVVKEEIKKEEPDDDYGETSTISSISYVPMATSSESYETVDVKPDVKPDIKPQAEPNVRPSRTRTITKTTVASTRIQPTTLPAGSIPRLANLYPPIKGIIDFGRKTTRPIREPEPRECAQISVENRPNQETATPPSLCRIKPLGSMKRKLCPQISISEAGTSTFTRPLLPVSTSAVPDGTLDKAQGSVKQLIPLPSKGSEAKPAIGLVNDDNEIIPFKKAKTEWNRYCQQVLLQNHDPTQLVECQICRMKLTVFYAREPDVNKRAITHVLKHCHAAYLRCRQCGHEDTENGMRRHLKQLHETKGLTKSNVVSMAHKHDSRVKAMIDECFGYSTKEAGEKSNRIQMELIDFCRDYLRKNYKAGELIPCSLCHVAKHYLPVDGEPFAYEALEHVLSHVYPPTYRCRLCNYASKTETAIKEHLRLVHSTEPYNALFREHLSRSSWKIVATVRKCFFRRRRAPPVPVTGAGIIQSKQLKTLARLYYDMKKN